MQALQEEVQPQRMQNIKDLQQMRTHISWRGAISPQSICQNLYCECKSSLIHSTWTSSLRSFSIFDAYVGTEKYLFLELFNCQHFTLISQKRVQSIPENSLLIVVFQIKQTGQTKGKRNIFRRRSIINIFHEECV